MERLFVDTSAWFALANRRDAEHSAVRSALRAFGGRLVTSNFVFDETVTLIASRLGRTAGARAGEVLLDPDTVDLVRVGTEDERAAWSLFVDRADQDCSFTDCTSFILMRRLGIATCAALDEDFSREGFRVVPQR